MKRIKKVLANGVLICGLVLLSLTSYAQYPTEGTAGDPYLNMPIIASIGERIEKYLTVSEAAKGPSIDPNKGYRLQKLGHGLYMITDNAYQSMFVVYENGVVVVDAPQPFAEHITKQLPK